MIEELKNNCECFNTIEECDNRFDDLRILHRYKYVKLNLANEGFCVLEEVRFLQEMDKAGWLQKETPSGESEWIYHEDLDKRKVKTQK